MKNITAKPMFVTLSLLALLLASIIVSMIAHISPFYGIGLTGTLTLITLLFHRPLWLLSTLIITRMSLDFFGEFTSFSITNGINVTLSQLIGLEVAFLGGLLLLTHPKSIRSLGKIWPFLLLFFWGSASAFISIEPTDTFRELLRIFDILTLFAITYTTVKAESQFKILLLSILASSFVPVSVAIYQWLTDTGFHYDNFDTQRIYGTFSHPNVLSLYLFSMIVFATLYYFLFAEKKWQKNLLIAIGIFYTIMLIATYTRIALIALIAFLGIIIVARFRSLILPFVLIPTMLYLLVPPLQERVNQSFQPSPDSSITWRVDLWKDTVNKTTYDDRTALGYGMNTFPKVSENLRGIQFGSNDPHNDFVKFFVEGGVLGLSLFCFYTLWINIMLFMRSIRNRETSAAKTTFLILFAFSFALTVSSLSDNVFKNTPVQWLFWIIIGASLSVFSQKIKRLERVQ